MGLFENDKVEKINNDFDIDKIIKTEVDKIFTKNIQCKLKEKKTRAKFNKYGYYIPQDIEFSKKFKNGIEELEIPLIVVDCTSIDCIISSLRNIHNQPYSVVIFDHFNEIPDGQEKKLVELLLSHLWYKFSKIVGNKLNAEMHGGKTYNEIYKEIYKEDLSSSKTTSIRKGNLVSGYSKSLLMIFLVYEGSAVNFADYNIDEIVWRNLVPEIKVLKLKQAMAAEKRSNEIN
jgi:hypothetical protein